MIAAQRRALVAIMIFYGLIMISPLFPYFGVRGTYLTLGLFALVFVVFGGTRIRLTYWFIFLSLVVLVLACVPTLFWMEPQYLLATIFLILSLLILQLADTRTIDSFLTVATVLMLLLLAGGIIGFILALNGVEPLFEIANSNGKPNYYFYTTFSNTRWGNVIRASGLFDEPGALSFMVCAVAALRHLRDRNSRITWLMLGMGFVTLSLAHLLYVLVHAMAEKLRLRNFIGIAATLLPLILVAGFLGGFEIVEKRLLARMTVSQTGEFVGDNRSWRMKNAVEHMRVYPESMLFGADPSCRFDLSVCKKKFPMMGENPLSPLVMQGIFISWPYYLTLATLLVAPVFGRRFIVSLAFGALLLQRPYMLGIGYSLIGLLVVAATIGGVVSDRRQPDFRRHMQGLPRQPLY